jgi:hypothetical protein
LVSRCGSDDGAGFFLISFQGFNLSSIMAFGVRHSGPELLNFSTYSEISMLFKRLEIPDQVRNDNKSDSTSGGKAYMTTSYHFYLRKNLQRKNHFEQLI